MNRPTNTTSAPRMPGASNETHAPLNSIDYASGRFGGGAGEVRVYGDDAATIERSLVIDGRGQYPQVSQD